MTRLQLPWLSSEPELLNWAIILGLLGSGWRASARGVRVGRAINFWPAASPPPAKQQPKPNPVARQAGVGGGVFVLSVFSRFHRGQRVAGAQIINVLVAVVGPLFLFEMFGFLCV